MKIYLKQHYHWIIAAVVLLTLAVYGGIINNLSSLHLIPVTEDLGISRGSFSLAFCIRSLVGFFSTLFSGVFLMKYGFRKLASLAMAVAAGALVLLGCSRNLWMLALASALVGACEGFVTTAAASRMVNTWFHSHQGLILGLVTASTGLGGSLFSVALSGIIENFSWRHSYWTCAVVTGVTAVLIFLLSRNRPSDMGLRPLGEGGNHGKNPRKPSRDHWQGYEARQVTRKPTFYLMILVVFAAAIANYIAFPVVSPHLQDCGMSPSEAAFCQSVLLLALAGAKFLCGTLSDYIGARVTNLICMGCTAAALVLLATVNGPVMAIIAMIVFSVALVMTSITIPLLSSALFGYRCQGSVVGVSLAVVPAASVITSPVVNMFYDRLGSYKPIFLFGAGMAVVTGILMVVLFILAARDRKRYEAAHQAMPKLEAIR